MNGTDPADPDATAVAMLQLSTITGNANVTTAITKAKAWLRSQQRCDGSFGGGPTTAGSNANSTGVIAWALGDTPASRQAATWLLPTRPPLPTARLARRRDAVPSPTTTRLSLPGAANGITDGQARTSGAVPPPRVLPGLKYYSTTAATPAISLTGPTAYLKAGSHPVVTTAGATAGTVLCVTGPGTSTRGIAGAAP